MKIEFSPKMAVLLFFVSFMFINSSFAQDIERLKKGVVKIETTTFEDKRKVGTGFIVQLEKDAVYIVTASHTVEGASEIKVEFFTHRNRLIPAEVIRIEGGDPQGLAVLLVEENIPSGVSALKLTSSVPVQGGESVTTIGFPRISGVPWAVIKGDIVGQTGKTITFSGTVDEGNSGGPLIKEGQVIGVVTEITEKFAYAIPIVIAQLVLESWGVKIEEAVPVPTGISPFSGSAQEEKPLEAGVVKITAASSGKVGTGFIIQITRDIAYIVTASHVVEGEQQPKIEFFTQKNIPVLASVVGLEGGDPRGLALLLVKGSENLPAGLFALSLTPSVSLKGGDEITVIGFPRLAGPWSVIKGNIVSRRGRDIIFDGAIDEGNSGGPMIKEGQVVGLVTGVSGPYGYALPAASVQLFLEGWGVDTTQLPELLPTATSTPFPTVTSTPLLTVTPTPLPTATPTPLPTATPTPLPTPTITPTPTPTATPKIEFQFNQIVIKDSKGKLINPENGVYSLQRGHAVTVEVDISIPHNHKFKVTWTARYGKVSKIRGKTATYTPKNPGVDYLIIAVEDLTTGERLPEEPISITVKE